MCPFVFLFLQERAFEGEQVQEQEQEQEQVRRYPSWGQCTIFVFVFFLRGVFQRCTVVGAKCRFDAAGPVVTNILGLVLVRCDWLRYIRNKKGGVIAFLV